MKWVRNSEENRPRSRNDSSVSSLWPSAVSASTRRAIRWKRGISTSIRRYDGRTALRQVGNRPARPSAPAHSSRKSSERTDMDMSESWVCTPSSSKSRIRWG